MGSETTSTTLLWTMLYLLHHEDVQARVHWEIDKVGNVLSDAEYWGLCNWGWVDLKKESSTYCLIMSGLAEI